MALVVMAGGCGSGTANQPAVQRPLVQLVPMVEDAAYPVGLVAEPEGGFLYGERLTGRIRRVTASGHLDAEPVAALDTVGSADDQRGLLGLAVLSDGRLFASWTRPADGRLVVGQVGSGASATVIWEGPITVDQANGGGLAVAADGTILIGIGDLLASHALGDDSALPNRKLLSLDPSGAADQRPSVLSTGWNNPYAITVARDGIAWVADNSAGSRPERMGRADRPATDAVDIDSGGPAIAPSGLVELAEGQFGVCGFVSHRVDEVRIVAGRPNRTGRVIADSCWTAVTVLVDGRIVTATLDGINISTRSVR